MTDVEEIIQRLRSFSRAYPEDIFPAPSKVEIVEVHRVFPGFTDRVSASMGRHIGKQLNEIADELEKTIRDEG